MRVDRAAIYKEIGITSVKPRCVECNGPAPDHAVGCTVQEGNWVKLQGRDVWAALGRRPEAFNSYAVEHGPAAVEAELLRSIRHYFDEARRLGDIESGRERDR